MLTSDFLTRPLCVRGLSQQQSAFCCASAGKMQLIFTVGRSLPPYRSSACSVQV